MEARDRGKDTQENSRQSQDKQKDGNRSLKLKMSQQNGTLLIQTDDLALQAIFSSPILEISDYLEQLEKFNYRAALSSINLKLDQFDQYYSNLKDRIENLYSAMVYRSMNMIQDLLIALRFAKVELWREQAAITNALRSHLYMKALDPYGFMISQFEPDAQRVCEQLKMPKNQVDKAKQEIEKYSKKLKKYEGQKMDQMYSGKVKFPYIAQNKDALEVDPSQLYASYLSNLKIKSERADEALVRRHFAIHEQILKFSQYACDHNIKYQRSASTLIRKYNEFTSNQYQANAIAPPLLLQGRRHHVDADELSPSRQQKSDSKPALANRQQKVEFKGANRVLQQQTGREQLIQHVENEEVRKQWERIGGSEGVLAKESPFQMFAERRRNNPKQFYQLRQFQKQKFRQEQLRERMREKDKDKQKVVIRRIIRAVTIPPTWTEFADQQCPFLHMIQARYQKEIHLWDIKNKLGDPVYLAYRIRKQKTPSSPFFRGSDQRNKYELEKKKQAQIEDILQQEEAISYQSRRKEEESLRINKIKRTIAIRSYSKFLAVSKIQNNIAPYCNQQYFSRYGISLSAYLQDNNPAEVDRFFYLYFKERIYRENEAIKDNADNPIITLDSSVYNMQSSLKVVSTYINNLLKKIENLPYFLIWSDDLFSYRFRENREGSQMQFDCYCYGHLTNSHKLVYELKRRVNLPVRERIFEEYLTQSVWQRIYSKVEVTHRLLFDRHRPLKTLELSCEKGKEIMHEILVQLAGNT